MHHETDTDEQAPRPTPEGRTGSTRAERPVALRSRRRTRGAAAFAGTAAALGIAAAVIAPSLATAPAEQAEAADPPSVAELLDEPQEYQADLGAAAAAVDRDEAVHAVEEKPTPTPTPEPEPQAASSSSSGSSGSTGESSRISGRGASYSAPSPGSNRALGEQLALSLYGWGSDEFACLDALWTQESQWNQYAQNPSSGAYGIPQSYPASKMASAGDDWRTNPETQIRWGLSYIAGTKHTTPCGIWKSYGGSY